MNKYDKLHFYKWKNVKCHIFSNEDTSFSIFSFKALNSEAGKNPTNRMTGKCINTYIYKLEKMCYNF